MKKPENAATNKEQLYLLLAFEKNRFAGGRWLAIGDSGLAIAAAAVSCVGGLKEKKGSFGNFETFIIQGLHAAR